MKLAFTTLGCPEWTLREIVENAARMGFDGVDFRGLLQPLDITTLPEFTVDLNATKNLFRDHGVEFAGLSSSVCAGVVEPAEQQRQLDEASRYLELAARLGAPMIRIFGGNVPSGHTPDSIMPYLVDNLRRIADEAGHFGVTVAIETHDDWVDSALLAKVMARVQHPWLGVLWDLHNPFRIKQEAPADTYNHIKSRLAGLHLKDSLPGPGGAFNYVPLGEGDVPLREMLALISRGGYQGYATLEWECRWHPELPPASRIFPHYIRTMREWLGALK